MKAFRPRPALYPWQPVQRILLRRSCGRTGQTAPVLPRRLVPCPSSFAIDAPAPVRYNNREVIA